MDRTGYRVINKKNPFKACLDPVKNPKNFITNEEIEESIGIIFDMLRSGDKINIGICGDRGTGKSSLINYIAARAKDEAIFPIINRFSADVDKDKMLIEIGSYLGQAKGTDCKKIMNKLIESEAKVPEEILGRVGYTLMIVAYIIFIYAMKIGYIDPQKTMPLWVLGILIGAPILICFLVYLKLAPLGREYLCENLKAAIPYRNVYNGIIILTNFIPLLREESYIKGNKKELSNIVETYRIIHERFGALNFKKLRGCIIGFEIGNSGLKDFLEDQHLRVYNEISSERELDVKKIVKSCIENQNQKENEYFDFTDFDNLIAKKFAYKPTKLVRDCIEICVYACENAIKSATKENRINITIKNEDVEVAYNVYQAKKRKQVRFTSSTP